MAAEFTEQKINPAADPLRGGRNIMGKLFYKEVSLTNDELLALAASPKTLVPAPGAGRVLEFESAVLMFDEGTTDFDDAASDGDLAIRYTDGSGTIVSTTLDADGFIDATADTIKTVKKLTTDISLTENAALVLDNTGAEFTGGVGAVLRVKVAYRVHKTGF